MKLTTIAILLLGWVSSFGQTIKVFNLSGENLEVFVWRDSKIINHHEMKDGDEFTIEGVGNGLLFQWKFKSNCPLDPSYFKYGEKTNSFGYTERYLPATSFVRVDKKCGCKTELKTTYFRKPIFNCPKA